MADGEKKVIKISVRNLVEFVMRSGDLDNRRTAGAEKTAMQEGSRIHRKIQRRMGADYHAEVVLKHLVEEEQFEILVEGRADASGLQPGGPSHTYSEFGPLTLFGEYEALCGANCFLAEVRARTACRFWVLAREDYFSWFFSGRDTTLSRVREVVRSLWEQARRERGYLSLDSDSRLLSFLVSWYEANAGGGTACIPMTRPAIGDETGVCSRTVNRGVRALRERGFLDIQSGKIQLSHPQYLRLRAELERRLADGRAIH